MELLYEDATGRVLRKAPYRLRSLFTTGQEIIVDSVPMTVVSCQHERSHVVTRVKLNKPWPNEK